jgi:hypothetical protein
LALVEQLGTTKSSLQHHDIIPSCGLIPAKLLQVLSANKISNCMSGRHHLLGMRILFSQEHVGELPAGTLPPSIDARLAFAPCT